MRGEQLWDRFQKYYLDYPSIGLSLDISRMNFADGFLASMQGPMAKAFEAMSALERGAIANPDENRMVGHYWLRNPKLAPTAEIRREIEQTLDSIKAFAADVQTAKVRGARGTFKNLLVIGIGGSALGPQFVASALGHPLSDQMKVFFFDNTDPDGFDRVLARLEEELGHTLCIVISKSGGTKETRNGMLEAKAAYQRIDLRFSDHAIAVTGAGSELDQLAREDRWLARFPMWDWVGGRTSETSAVGLLPAALQGLDIQGILTGAAACDEITRQPDLAHNPAALLALMWYYIGDSRGTRAMVVLPYKDRLELFSRYLQQLVMESLGKEKDLDGKVVHQGLAVYGNKGSTDQHAYIQQLRDGLNNFFVLFIEVLRDRENGSLEVDSHTTSGDYLLGFLLGTREALYESGRESIKITLKDVSPRTIGSLIALFERAVGFYASLINVNAYHQPGVEAGKKAASGILALQSRLIGYFAKNRGKQFAVTDLASALDATAESETVFELCEHLVANNRSLRKISGKTPFEAKYQQE